MSFINPWGLISFISIPILIVLYILKQQHSEHVVSSIILWKNGNVYAGIHSSSWKETCFFFSYTLHFSLAISRPVILSEALDEDFIAIIDTSASMRAEDVSQTGLNIPKEILRLVNGLCQARNEPIEAGNTVTLLVSRSDTNRC